MSERKPTQLCTICGAQQPLSAQRCGICGAALSGQPVPIPANASEPSPGGMPSRPLYDPAAGDDDLYAGEVTRRIQRMAMLAGILLLLAMVAVAVLLLDPFDDDGDPGVQVEGIAGAPTAPPTATARSGDSAGTGLDVTEVGSPTPAATARPGMNLPTVTPAPPTPTESPTQGPCVETAQTGDTIYAMASRCGHRDLSIVDVILQLNDMDSAEELQIGQSLEIPWPTPTGGAPVDGSGAETNALGTPDPLATYTSAEPTLRPGQAWHTVQAGETIISIAYDYDTDLETLSQINPEVPFLQCDYGSPTGGDNCTVLIVEGQQIRVPVPLPSPTVTASPVGTLTPTLTTTPAFNAPYLVAPEDEAHFNADQMVTLRWGGTGSLRPDERYVLHVRDEDTGQEYVASMRETAYILPGGWQPVDRRRHTFEWSVSTGTADAQGQITAEDHAAESRTFTWDSR